MKRAAASITVALLLVPRVLYAHEGSGPEPADEAAAMRTHEAALSRPHLLADGRLYVSKAMQHTLGLRTEVFSAQPHSILVNTIGEVIAGPNSAGSITAAQAGRLEAPPQGWPLPGSTVAAGATLAYLRPLLPLREQAQRRAALAQIDNDLQISEINVARLKLQAEANGSIENNGNVYYEQARLEWEGLKEKYRLESEALDSRLAIQAPAHGVLLSASVQPGEVVAEGQALFEIADPQHLRVALRSFDTTLAARLQSAELHGGETGEQMQPMILRGSEPLAGQQGWRLLFDAATPIKMMLAPGQLVQLGLHLAMPNELPNAALACVAGTDGQAWVWVHVAPEIFERRKLPPCQFGVRDGSTALAIAAGERVVTQGAALLSEYH